MSKTKKPSEILIFINYCFFRVATGIIWILPLHAAYVLARIISWCAFTFDRKHSQRAVTHVLHSGIRTDRKEAVKLAKASFLHMAKVLVEVIKFDQIINAENFHEYVTAGKDPVSQQMLNPDTTFQIILATAHLGNWELAGGCHSKLTGIPMTSIGRPLSNWRIGEYFFKKRCSFDHHSFTKDKGLRPFLAAWKQGHNLTIVSDQHCSSSEGVEVTFFGHPARAHATPALLHLKTRLPISLPYLVRVDDDFHFELRSEGSFVYEPTGDKEKDIKTIVQKYTDMIEKGIRKVPEQWLWAHRRWLDCGRHEAANYVKKEENQTEKTDSGDEK